MSQWIASNSTRLTLLLIGLLIVFGAGLRGHNLYTVSERSPDERVYLAQADALATGGLAGIRQLARDYMNDPQRLYPPPSRTGYTAPFAGLIAFSGQHDVRWGALLSCLCSIGSMLLVAAMGYRFLTPAVAVLATALYATFPAELVLARRAWTDAGLEFLACSLLYLGFMLGRRMVGRGVPTLIFMGLSAWLVMTKEASVVVLAFCLGWLLWVRGREAWRLVLACGLAVVFGVWLNAWLIGGWPVLWDIQSRFAEFNAGNAYSQDYQTGPVQRLWQSFFFMSPVVFALALLGLAAAWPLSGLVRDRRVVLGLAGFSAVMLLLPVVLPSWLNLRFASPVNGPLCLLAALALYAVGRWLMQRLPDGLHPWLLGLGLGVLLIHAGRDWRFFEQGFVQRGTPDLSSRMVFAVAGVEWPGAGTVSAPAVDPRAAQALQESLRLYQEKRYEASLRAARQALALHPGYAEAYNNLAAAHAELGQWDAAIEAAQQAVRLAPGWQLALNNLAWAQQEKAKQSGALSR